MIKKAPSGRTRVQRYFVIGTTFAGNEFYIVRQSRHLFEPINTIIEARTLRDTQKKRFPAHAHCFHICKLVEIPDKE